MNKTELKETQLEKAVGGLHEEQKLYILLDLPDAQRTVEVHMYIDGVLHDTYSLDTLCIREKTFTIPGTRGVKLVHFKLDGQLYRQYSLDFDAGIVTRIY